MMKIEINPNPVTGKGVTVYIDLDAVESIEFHENWVDIFLRQKSYRVTDAKQIKHLITWAHTRT